MGPEADLRWIQGPGDSLGTLEVWQMGVRSIQVAWCYELDPSPRAHLPCLCSWYMYVYECVGVWVCTRVECVHVCACVRARCKRTCLV